MVHLPPHGVPCAWGAHNLILLTRAERLLTINTWSKCDYNCLSVILQAHKQTHKPTATKKKQLSPLTKVKIHIHTLTQN